MKQWQDWFLSFFLKGKCDLLALAMIIVRSPLRVSLAGGGSDVNDYYNAGHGFGAVCSIAINKYVYVTLNNLSSYFPHRFRIAYSQTELTQDIESIKHPIVRVALSEMGIQGGIDINVMSDVPAGTGLGSSSSFTVSLLHALSAFRHCLASKEFLAKEACRLEIDVLHEPVGKQDQYAAAFGGINLFRFHHNEQVGVEPLPLSEKVEQRLMRHLMLFYLGGNRSASRIMQEQRSNMPSKTAHLGEMRDQALRMAEILTQSASSEKEDSLDELGALLKRGWMLKRGLSQSISTSIVDEAMEAALAAGALGGKLLGAGGTGFLLLYVSPHQQAKVREALAEFSEVPFGIDHMGSSLLYYGND